ncbi:MAG: TonB-dependent receptor [Bacteroidales bacterium]|nr:TonB-dependent receptor [Bacteroidales bacterium]
MKNVLLSITAVMLFCVASLSAVAQVDTLPINVREILDKSNISYDEVVSDKLVISAGRTTKSVDELPVTLYIISHEEIIRNGYVTLCDVLKSVPGIRVSQPCSGEFGEAFMQRGMMGNTYTKILLNGLDIKPSAPTGMPLGANIPVRQAERIEIVYGPAAASYGNDACSGVINIVTKQDFDKPFADADVVTGTGDYHYINFMAGGKFGRGKHVAQCMLYGTNLRYKNMNVTDYDKDDLFNRWNYFEQRGVPFVCSIDSFMPTEMTPERYDKLPAMFMAKLPQFREIIGYTAGWHGDTWYPEIAPIQQEAAQAGIELKYRGVTLSYNYMYRKDFTSLGQTPMLFRYDDSDFMQGEKIIRAVITGSWTFGKFSTTTVLKYFRYRMDDNSQRGVCYSPYTQYMYGAGDDAGFEEHITYQVSNNFSFGAGVLYQYSGVLPMTNESPYKFPKKAYKTFAKTVNYTDPIYGEFGIYPYAYYTNGAYGQAEWSWKMISLTGGLRYDFNSMWGSTINPRIAALVKITDKLTFRVARGYAYKAPSAQQMYGCTAVDASITINNVYQMLGYPAVDTSLVAFQQVPAQKLEPEKIASTEFGLRYYLNNTNYLELVAYTNRVRNPIDRCWGELDTSLYKGIGSTAIIADKPYSRTYRNLEDAEIKLRGYQFILVMKNLVEPVKLNVNCGFTLSMGHEDIYDNNFSDDSNFDRMNHIRQTPRYQAQLAFDLTLFRIMNLRAENVYCSKWARKYYSSPDNEYFWPNDYYCLDLSLGLHISKHLYGMAKVTNVLNTRYGGIDSKELDVDLPYNPQQLCNLRLCLSYNF